MPKWENTISNDHSYDGSRSLHFPFEIVGSESNPTGHNWSERRFNLGRNLTEAWVEYMIRIPDNFELMYWDGNTYNNKFFTLWAEDYSHAESAQVLLEFTRNPASGPNGTSTTVASARMMGRIEGQSSIPTLEGYRNSEFITAEMAGQWKRFRAHARLASGPGQTDGVFEGWLDDVLAFRSDGEVLRSNSGAQYNYFRHGYLMGSDSAWPRTRLDYYIDRFRVYDQDPGWPETT